MANSNPSSSDPSRAPTPNASHNARFTSQAATAEDLLKSHTVGLVHLNDFRKRRAEALEQKEREAHGGNFGRFTAASNPGTPLSSDGVTTPNLPVKKKRKPAAKGKISFGIDDEDGDGNSPEDSTTATPRSATPDFPTSRTASPITTETSEKRKIGPNARLNFVPKVMTKSALLREAQTKEQLRKEFLAMQEAVKATEIVIPFVFYDGTNIPGGSCKVKKGDYIWLFLDRSRKHYDFYYFIVNQTLGHSSVPLFDYSSTMPLPPSHPDSSSPSPSASPEPSSTYDPLARPSKPQRNTGAVVTPADRSLEGVNDDPTFTKVVDRRWYERNKHIFPASVWEAFDPNKDYSKGMRRDAEGNAFFFS
ncbi:MAG: hypothetical protein Q9219_004997 [cf. Caloplaca sp. 3 TL-2023]